MFYIIFCFATTFKFFSIRIWNFSLKVHVLINRSFTKIRNYRRCKKLFLPIATMHMTLTYRNYKSPSCNYSDSYKNIRGLKRVCTTTPNTVNVNWFPIGHIRSPQHDLCLAVSINSPSKCFIQLSLARRPSTVKSTPVGDGIVFCLTKHVYIILCCMCHFIVFDIEFFVCFICIE